MTCDHSGHPSSPSANNGRYLDLSLSVQGSIVKCLPAAKMQWKGGVEEISNICLAT
ncbi:hypothetical protein PISMIDRAFT_670933 [Pisolithus microcarpus 441]|uniref:Uncharacterized protein n=1 Tax=Pisolithus microcarpus 441 TaxID=765257 RepID=A0A0D0A8P2_9AGAM|nr:hypothetical protein PISMIDRAFT_670933 [Pisolithus microcarpus 441]